MKGFAAGYLLLDEVLLSMLWSDGSFQFANHSIRGGCARVIKRHVTTLTPASYCIENSTIDIVDYVEGIGNDKKFCGQ